MNVVGIDIGGSKTHGVRVEDGQVVAEARVDSANAASMGIGEATRRLDELVDRLGCSGVDAVCAGAAGADTVPSRERLRTWLRHRFPRAAVEVVHDAPLVLAAAGLGDGVAVISGTGSVAWGVHGGTVARAGGWGHLLGDEGSGCWVGRQAVRHALAGADRGAEPDGLSTALTAACGLRSPAELLDHLYATPQPRYWAERADVVFDRAAVGDRAATAIIDAAAAALVELATGVCRRVGLSGPVVLAGGLAVHRHELSDLVRRGLEVCGISDVRILDADPVYGAVRLAERLLQAGADGAGRCRASSGYGEIHDPPMVHQA